MEWICVLKADNTPKAVFVLLFAKEKSPEKSNLWLGFGKKCNALRPYAGHPWLRFCSCVGSDQI